MSFILQFYFALITPICSHHCLNDSVKEMYGNIVFIGAPIDEAFISPDTSSAKKSFASMQKIRGYRLPPSDNFDLYKLSKIASRYKIWIELKDLSNKTIKKKIIVSVIRAKISFTPWNTGMPKSEGSWKFKYKDDKINLSYLIDLDGAILFAKPIDRRDIKKFNKFRDSPPVPRVM